MDKAQKNADDAPVDHGGVDSPEVALGLQKIFAHAFVVRLEEHEDRSCHHEDDEVEVDEEEVEQVVLEAPPHQVEKLLGDEEGAALDLALQAHHYESACERILPEDY